MAKKQKFKDELTKDIASGIRTQDTVEAAIAELDQLARSGGWNRVIPVLDQKIADFTNLILDTDIKDSELDRTRDRRDLCLWFRNLPEILIEALKNPAQPELQDFDPYDKPPKQFDFEDNI